MVSVLHKELEYKVGKLGGHVAKDQKYIWTSSWWINHPGSVQSTQSSTVVIDQYSLSFISEE